MTLTITKPITNHPFPLTLRRIYGSTLEGLVAAFLRKMEKKRYLRSPRPLFTTVFLETVTICNNDCSFCPISVPNSNREYNLMPEELFDAVIAELESIAYRGRIALYNNNDPLIDRRLPDLAARARRRCPGARIQVMTNGILLTPELGRSLFKAGIDDLIVNNYDDSFALIPSVRKFLEGFQDPGHGTVEIVLRRKTQRLTNRAGMAPNAAPLAKPIPGFCVLPFRELNVAYDGRVPLCCADTQWRKVLGNVREKGLLGVWFGGVTEDVREKLFQDRRDLLDPCATCDHRGYKDVPRDLISLLLR